MTNLKQIVKFEKTIQEAVHEYFNSLDESLEPHDVQDMLGIMQYQIQHIWMEANQKVGIQNNLLKRNVRR